MMPIEGRIGQKIKGDRGMTNISVNIIFSKSKKTSLPNKLEV